MKILVLYDIGENKKRNSVVDTLDEFGFYRLQKSLFIGNLKEQIYESFLAYIGRHINRKDKIYIIPLSENSFKNISTLGESKRAILTILKNNELEIF